MKEIKFRVWDKKDKSMHIVISLHHPNHLDYCEYSLGQSSDGVRTVRYVDCEIMQYTGFKDKNRKEIYEGDIVIIKGRLSIRKAEVRRNREELMFYTNMVYLNNPMFSEGYHISDILKDKLEIKIIGNIYENKKLLKEKK